MAESRTKVSTSQRSDDRRLSEVARHVVIPEGIVTTGWPAVEAKCAEWGDSFDGWQRGAGQVMLGKRADGQYAATVGGITLSVPRQVFKTFIVGRIVMAQCALFPGLRVLWTAHHTATLSNTFRSLAGYARRKRVAPYVAHVRRGSGKESIEFTNGSVIYFGAREQGFGRGFDEVDVEVFDEAQILTEKALEDMVAATNQSRHPHGALLFYMGTPPRPSDPGEVFTSRRRKALALKDSTEVFAEPTEAGDAVYIECSADPDVGRADGPGLDDREQLRRANPSFPLRTPPASVQRLRENLPSDEAWRREGLGVWDDAGTVTLVGTGEWSKLIVDDGPPAGSRAYGVRFTSDGSRVGLAVAVKPTDGGPVFVEVVDVVSMSRGLGWLVDWLEHRWRDSLGIVVDGKSGASLLVNELRAVKVPGSVIVTPTTEQAAAAYAGWLDAVIDGALSHAGQPGLSAAVAVAGRRKIGNAGLWGVQPVTSNGDVLALEAVALAHYGAKASKRRPGRKAKVRVG